MKKVIELNGKNFEVIANLKHINDAIRDIEESYSKDKYYLSVDELHSEKGIEKQRWLDAVEWFKKDLKMKIKEDYIKTIVEDAKKKKNGTFAKGRVYDSCPMDYSEHDGNNLVFEYDLRYKTIDDFVMELTINMTREMR